ncbi:MAG: right-handed parallel beta-helix repeat-containing protein [Planctomycetota bacterium]|nr:right-handed parallel beta-helix repeat-containing protein [Planctomycetota bacterium]
MSLQRWFCINLQLLLIIALASVAVIAQDQGSSLYKEEPYDPDAPAYPRAYSEAEKAAQREAGIRFIQALNAAAKEKKPGFKLEPGVYRLPHLPDYKAEFKLEYLETFTLDLAGCEIILEDNRKFGFPKHIKNLSIVGPAIFDADPLPYTQGRIIANDPKTFRTTVEIGAGCYVGFRPKDPGRGTVYAFSSDGRWLHNRSWAMYTNGRVIDPEKRIVEFTAEHDRDIYESIYAVGNRVAIDHGPSLLDSGQVRSFTLKDLDLYWGGGVMWGQGDGDWNIIRVRDRRRPGTNRLFGCGSFQVDNPRGRTLFDSCEFSYTIDDILDYQPGSLGMIWERTGDRELIVRNNGNPIEPNHKLAFWRDQDFAPVGCGTVVKAERVPADEAKSWDAAAAEYIKKNIRGNAQTGRTFWRVTLAEPTAAEKGVKVENTFDRQLEFTMRNCYWHDAGVSMGLQGCAKATIVNNHFVRIKHGLKLLTASWWWEGSTVNNLTIENNVFLQTTYGRFQDWRVGKAATSIHNETREHIASMPDVYPNNHITIRNNLFRDSCTGGIWIANSADVTITGNTFQDLFTGLPQADGKGRIDGSIAFFGCSRIKIADNAIDRCVGRAIAGQDVADLAIVGNRIANARRAPNDNPSAVISVLSGRNVKISGNRVEATNAEKVVLLDRCNGVIDEDNRIVGDGANPGNDRK